MKYIVLFKRKKRKKEVVRTGVSETLRTNGRTISWHVIRKFTRFNVGNILTEKGVLIAKKKKNVLRIGRGYK